MISALVEQHKVDSQQAFAPAPSERRGECPTLQKPMQTGDGLLARLRPIDNVLTVPQLRALAEAAERFGNGIIEITARGSLQVRGLKPETVTPFEGAVLASGIRIASGVGVETPPLAGLDPDELIDVRPLAAELRRRIAEHVPPLLLAPKLAITLDGGGRFHLSHVAADIKVTAFSHDDRIDFLLAASDRSVGIVAPDRLIDAIVDLLEKLAAIGPGARGRDLRLPEIQGQVSQRELSPLMGIHMLSSIDTALGLPPSVLPDISPSRGENGWGAGFAPYDQPVFVDNDFEAISTAEDQGVSETSTLMVAGESAASLSPPLRGRWPAGQRGVSPDATLLESQSEESENVTEGHQPEYALGLAFAYRQASSADLTAFADTAEALCACELRLAPDHGLFVNGLTLGKAQQLQKTAATLGFLTSSDDPRRAICLCAGARGCASAFYDTQGLAEKLLRYAPDLLDGSFDLHLSGCAKGCAHPAASPLAFVGARAGYGLVVNGAASASPATYIAQNHLDTALTRLQALLQQSKEDGETAQACLVRLGGGAIAAALQLDGT